MIDFKKLQSIVPEGGSVTLTVTHAAAGKLSVLMSSKRKLAVVNSTYEKSLEDDKKAIEKASKGLSKVLAFSGTPEDLTASFEKKITENCTAERLLVEVINERTAELNEQIKALKNKKVSGKPATTSGCSAGDKTRPEERCDEACEG